jgi:hypothetical protein
MGIQITNAEVFPAIEYNKVHLVRLEISQPVFTNDSLQPVYVVNVAYKVYGVLNGTRYYKDEPVREITIPNFIDAAMADAANGDMSLANSLVAIEGAVASIIADNLQTQVSVV